LNNNCTLYKTVDIISKKWSLLILLELFKQGKRVRYNKLKKNIPKITAKILSLRLKELQKHGLILRDVDPEVIPVGSYYSLTKSGMELIKIVQEIKGWSLKWRFPNKMCEATDCQNCGL